MRLITVGMHAKENSVGRGRARGLQKKSRSLERDTSASKRKSRHSARFGCARSATSSSSSAAAANNIFVGAASAAPQWLSRTARRLFFRRSALAVDASRVLSAPQQRAAEQQRPGSPPRTCGLLQRARGPCSRPVAVLLLRGKRVPGRSSRRDHPTRRPTIPIHRMRHGV